MDWIRIKAERFYVAKSNLRKSKPPFCLISLSAYFGGLLGDEW